MDNEKLYSIVSNISEELDKLDFTEESKEAILTDIISTYNWEERFRRIYKSFYNDKTEGE